MARIGEMGDLCKCSFCGSGQRQVNRLIAGPGVYICNQCVDFCGEILDEEAAVGTRPPVPVADIEKMLRNWISSVDRLPVEQVREARNLFIGLASHLDALLDLPGSSQLRV